MTPEGPSGYNNIKNNTYRTLACRLFKIQGFFVHNNPQTEA